jgi:diguanylate cyclase (GGDEF)-like protein
MLTNRTGNLLCSNPARGLSQSGERSRGSHERQPTDPRKLIPTHPARAWVVTRMDGDPDARTLSDDDQTTADADQTTSDLDQTSADSDQSHSDRDQLAANRDQDASDFDQALSDRGDGDGAKREHSRKERLTSSVERDQTSRARADTATIRDDSASMRDRLADGRDHAAQSRDRLAAALDAQTERAAASTPSANGDALSRVEILARATDDRRRAAASRERAAANRDAAVGDRELAAADRGAAARDRVAAAEQFALEGVDHLTGVFGRRVGLEAIRREMDRTRRNGETLVLAFIDVDGLKAVNDGDGHAAGDEMLRAVVGSITRRLRSYDVITRYGGDEFLCSLSGQDATAASERFAEIAHDIANGGERSSFTVGLVEWRDDEPLEELIGRADSAMIDARRLPES